MTRWQTVIQGGAVLGLLAYGGPSAGQEIRRVDPVTVTATRIEEPLERIGASVSVITEDEIRNLKTGMFVLELPRGTQDHASP